jgi:Domain of unknown function (DUF4055)
MAQTETLVKKGKSDLNDAEKVTFQHPAYADMAGRWKMLRDVNAGTEAMRAEGNLDTYLPRGPAESVDQQKRRAARTELFPMLKETIKGLTGLVFRKDPVFGADVPRPIVDLLENIDGAGTHISIFAQNLLSDGLLVGHGGILVDVPKVSSTKPLTIRQERDMGLRPYWVHIKPEQIVNWRTRTINGHLVLTLLVIQETVEIEVGDFGVGTATRFRVFRRDNVTGIIDYQVWTQTDETKDPELDDFGSLRNVSIIPFVAFYAGKRVGPLQSLPPLLDLGYTNIAHYQVLSDLRSSLHAAGNPILVIKGRRGGNISRDPNIPLSVQTTTTNPDYATEGPAAGLPADSDELVIGPESGIEVDKEGDVTYAEHAGNAIGGTQAEISNIETRGAAQGLAMLQRSTRAAQTAETERLQRNEKDASLSSAARNLEDCLEIALALTALFMVLGTGGTVTIDKSFEDTTMDTPRFQAFSQATAAGQFTRRTFWTMLIKGGILPEDFDMDAEEAALDAAARIELNRQSEQGDGSGADGKGPADTTASEDTGNASGGGSAE